MWVDSNMKIDELIEELEQVKEDHGNLEVRGNLAKPISISIKNISNFQSQIFDGEVNDEYLEL